MVTLEKNSEMSTDLLTDEGMKTLLETSGDLQSGKEGLEAALTNCVKSETELGNMGESEKHADELSGTCIRSTDVKVEHQDIVVKTEPDPNVENTQPLAMITDGDFEDSVIKVEGSRDNLALGNEYVERVGKSIDMVEVEQNISGKNDSQTLFLSDVLSAVNWHIRTIISDNKTEGTDYIATTSELDNESNDIDIDIDGLGVADEFRDESLLKNNSILDCYKVLTDIEKITNKTKSIVAQKYENMEKTVKLQNDKEIEICKKMIKGNVKSVKKKKQKKFTKSKIHDEIKVKCWNKIVKQKQTIKPEIPQKEDKIVKKVMEKQDETEKLQKVKDSKDKGKLKVNTFKCRDCSMSFGNIRSLQSHSKIHWNLNLICKICGPVYRYSTKEGFEKHLALHGKVNFECSTCGRIFSNERKLKFHGIKHGIKPFSCDQCPKAYNSQRFLDDHKRTHTNERPFKCGICNASFTSSMRLDYHAFTHSDYKYPCKICGKVFKRKEDLVWSHMGVHSDARPFKCPLCDKTYKYRSSLRLHNRSHTGEKVTCEICQKSFRDPSDLKKHSNIHSGLKPHLCDTCGLFFRQRHILQSHIKHVHTNPSLIEKKFKHDKPDKYGKCFENHSSLMFQIEKTFECKQCTKTFKSKNLLERHVKRVHDKTGEKIECSKCDKTFTAVEYLRKHMKIHQFGRQYLCSQCGLAYTYSNHLKRHVDKAHSNV